MAEKDEKLSPEARDTIRRNVEGSRKLIEEREATRAGQRDEPNRNDPRHNDQGVPPRQDDVPAGGTSNPNFTGGSSKRHKPD